MSPFDGTMASPPVSVNRNWKINNFDQEFQKMKKQRDQLKIKKFEKLSKDLVALYLSTKSNGYKTINNLVQDT